MSNLPSSSTAGRRVLIATPGFAALGLVTPDFTIPSGFLPLANGTVNYAGVDQVTYASLPTDGTDAIDRSGAPVQNVATNFAGASASVSGLRRRRDDHAPSWVCGGTRPRTAPATTSTSSTAYWSCRCSRTKRAGTPSGMSPPGRLPTTAPPFTATLDKYRGGQCLTCPYTGRPTLVGNDGTITITFTSSTSAVVNLPNNRVSPIQPQVF